MSDRNSNVNINSNNNTNNIGTTINNNIITSDKKCHKCNKTFATAQTLKTHLMTINCSKDTITTNRCEYCEKDFSSKQMFTYHSNICMNKKISLVSIEYENKIKQLENEIMMLKNLK